MSHKFLLLHMELKCAPICLFSNGGIASEVFVMSFWIFALDRGLLVGVKMS